MHAQHAHARVHVHAHVHVHMHIYNREEQQTRLGVKIEITANPLGRQNRNNSRPAWEILPAHFAPHTLPWSCWWLDVSPRCPGAGGGWISPTQAPPFERHPRPAGDEGNATAKVAPSGLGQSQVVEPESARTRPGSRDTHGQGLLERAQMWSVMRRVRVTLPLHYRYITVTSPLHHGYVTRILGARRGVLVAVAAVKTRRRLARTLGRVRGAGRGMEPSLGHDRCGSLQWLPSSQGDVRSSPMAYPAVRSLPKLPLLLRPETRTTSLTRTTCSART